MFLFNFSCFNIQFCLWMSSLTVTWTQNVKFMTRGCFFLVKSQKLVIFENDFFKNVFLFNFSCFNIQFCLWVSSLTATWTQNVKFLTRGCFFCEITKIGDFWNWFFKNVFSFNFSCFNVKFCLWMSFLTASWTQNVTFFTWDCFWGKNAVFRYYF